MHFTCERRIQNQRSGQEEARIRPESFQGISIVFPIWSSTSLRNVLCMRTRIARRAGDSLAAYGGEAMTAWNWCTSLFLLMMPAWPIDGRFINRSNSLAQFVRPFYDVSRRTVGVQFRAAHYTVAATRYASLDVELLGLLLTFIWCEAIRGRPLMFFQSDASACWGWSLFSSLPRFCINKTQRRPIPPAIISHLGF